MRYTHLFFDLDDTLYRSDNGLWEVIRERMSLFMVQRLNMSPSQVEVLRERYYREYGTTLRGLQLHYQVDANEYLAFVHDVDLQAYLQPDPALREMIHSLPQKKWIFTNADANHALRVLDILRLENCFEGIIDIRALEFVCKPEPQAFERALFLAGSPSPGSCVLCDDALHNLSVARELGFVTVWVNHNAQRTGANKLPPYSSTHYAVQSLVDLPQVLPELWNHLPSGYGE